MKEIKILPLISRVSSDDLRSFFTEFIFIHVKIMFNKTGLQQCLVRGTPKEICVDVGGLLHDVILDRFLARYNPPTDGYIVLVGLALALIVFLLMPLFCSANG
jgi:hypothetical protein